MRLQRKFSLLIVGLIIVTLSINILMFVSFQQLITLKEQSEELFTQRYTLFAHAFYAVITISAVLVFIILRSVTGSITKRISQLKTLSLKLSQKDLRYQISDKSKDELGELVRDLSATVSVLDGVFQEVKESASTVKDFGGHVSEMTDATAAATSQIKTSMDSLRKQFATLYQSVDVSMKKLEDMSDVALSLVVDNQQQTESIQSNAKDMTAIAETIRTIAETSVEKTRSAEQIQDFVTDGDGKIKATANLLQEVTSQLDQISGIVTIINKIAQKTNILSMNAAIESAHAGAAGRGFSVVAEEIRQLAESTAGNAKQISQSINTVVRKVKQADDASALAAEAFARVSEHAEDMVSSLKDITKDIGEADIGLADIDSRTQNIAATARKISSECDSLNIQQMDVSEAMAQMHGVFFEVRGEVEEIQHGADDIVDRALEVSDLTTENERGMEALSMSLDRFMTTDMKDGKKAEKTAAAAEVKKAPVEEPEELEELEELEEIPEVLAPAKLMSAESSSVFGDNPFGSVEVKVEKHTSYAAEPENEEELFDYFLS